MKGRLFAIAPCVTLLVLALAALLLPASSVAQSGGASAGSLPPSLGSPPPAVTVPGSASQSETRSAPPLHVNVRLVNVFVNVIDKNGEPVGGLTEKDFALSEDGRPQKIAYFERETNVPLSIVMAIDTSGSTRVDLPLERAAARDFAFSILGHPNRRRAREVAAAAPTAQMELMDFNSSVREVVPFTSDPRAIEWGLRHLDYGPATALYDAIAAASRLLAGRDGRKALVIISDGGNTVGEDDYPEALEAARRASAIVYSIIDVPVMADAGRDTAGEHAMISMSGETGGRYFYAYEGDLASAFEKVAVTLRTQYMLSYYPSADRIRDSARFRRISVTLTRAAAAGGPYTIENRAGYYPDTSE